MTKMSDAIPVTNEELARMVKKGFDENSSQFHEIRGRLDGIDDRLDGHDQRFTGLEQRFTGLEQRFTGLERRLGGVENSQKNHDQRFDGLERRADAMADDIGEIKHNIKKLVTRREHEALKKKVLAMARAR